VRRGSGGDVTIVTDMLECRCGRGLLKGEASLMTGNSNSSGPLLSGGRAGVARFVFVLCLLSVGLALTATSGAEVIPNADLAVVSNVANVAHAKVGDMITFTIIATNHGPDAAELDVYFASGEMHLVSESCDLGISPDTPACEYTIVEPGQTVTTTAVAEVLDTGSKHAVGTACIVEQAEVINDPDDQNNCAASTVKIVGKR
jgi:hypothetical protein